MPRGEGSSGRPRSCYRHKPDHDQCQCLLTGTSPSMRNPGVSVLLSQAQPRSEMDCKPHPKHPKPSRHCLSHPKLSRHCISHPLPLIQSTRLGFRV